ncbi:MAG TPA: hypothetical protein VHW69_03920 [Rhizomicrobium sp.]|nr:hypothetical protein [Rhizomicrobium sp.]
MSANPVLKKRSIAVVVITSTSWPRVQKQIPAIVDAINRIDAGAYIEVTVP